MSKHILILTDSIGSAHYELGTVLMTSFFMNLAEVEHIPETISFLNEGARLTCEGSKVIDFISKLEERGTVVKTCQTCLEYLDIEDTLVVGTVGSMHATVKTMLSVDNVITIS